MHLVLAAMAATASSLSRLDGAPRLGLGMAALGRPGYINLGHASDLPEERSVEAMREHAHAVLDEAVRLGLRYIDCARSYGLSEDFVASWMSRRDGQHCVVGSKWGTCLHTCLPTVPLRPPR